MSNKESLNQVNEFNIDTPTELKEAAEIAKAREMIKEGEGRKWKMEIKLHNITLSKINNKYLNSNIISNVDI